MRAWKRILLVTLVLGLLLGMMPVAAATRGDLNEDGNVDYADAIYLLYYTLLPAEYPLPEAADYTGDGITDQEDAVYLLYHALLPAKYPLPGGTVLPEVGYDPDGKGRISLTAIALEEGVVTATFTNRSNTWVTEEIATLTYTCTAADGRVLKTGTVHLGYLKCGGTTTCRVTLPADTAVFAFTGGNIPYWSGWKQ